MPIPLHVMHINDPSFYIIRHSHITIVIIMCQMKLSGDTVLVFIDKAKKTKIHLFAYMLMIVFYMFVVVCILKCVNFFYVSILNVFL